LNDPHVATLTYRVLATEDFEFKDAPPLEFDAQAFTGRLADSLLTLTVKQHVPTEAEARAIADPFIAAWEIHAGASLGRPDFRLRYEGAQILDRAPAPGTHALHLTATAHASASAHLKVTRHEYPPAPAQFAVTPEVEVLWERYCRYLAGKEPLLSMAYFCLTILERQDRRAAAQHFGIEYAVLNKLGELTSTRGDDVTARKMTAKTILLTGSERVWIEAAIKAIILHLGTRGRGATLLMATLPPP